MASHSALASVELDDHRVDRGNARDQVAPAPMAIGLARDQSSEEMRRHDDKPHGKVPILLRPEPSQGQPPVARPPSECKNSRVYQRTAEPASSFSKYCPFCFLLSEAASRTDPQIPQNGRPDRASAGDFHRMVPNYFKRPDGDRINAMLAAAGRCWPQLQPAPAQTGRHLACLRPGALSNRPRPRAPPNNLNPDSSRATMIVRQVR